LQLTALSNENIEISALDLLGVRTFACKNKEVILEVVYFLN